MDRRKFLTTSMAGGATLASAAAVAPAAARPTRKISPDAVGLLYDSTLCIGCKACVAACKLVNEMPPEYAPGTGTTWDTPLDLSGRTLNVIKVYGSGAMKVKDQETDGFAFVKKSCLHCVDPSCVSACPVSAMRKDPVTGIVSYSKEACIGCRYCVAACPFRVPRFTYDRAFPQISKCQLCRHRLPEGKYSACAEVCPTGATLYGRVADLKKEAARRLALKPGTATAYPRGRIDGPDQSYLGVSRQYVNRVYGETEFGGTQLIMLAGVPFEHLGYPNLPPQSDAANSETMQHTLYAGLVVPAAFLGVLAWAAKRSAAAQEEENGDE